MKVILSVFVLLLGNSLFAGDPPVAPSSVIPAKREFPLNEKINPCDDFHEYVCSNAEAGFKLRDDRSRHTFSFNDSSERILEAKKTFFKEIKKQKTSSARSKQIKDFYLACMDESNGAKTEKAELDRLIKELQAIKTNTDFANYQIKAMDIGNSSLISWGSGANQDEPKISDMYIDIDLMNLPEYTYYDNPELMKDYKDLIVSFFRTIESSQSDQQLADRADKVIAFEKAFVKIYPHPEVQRQRWSEKRTQPQAEFLTKYPNEAMTDYLNKVPKSILIFNAFPEAHEFYNQAMGTEKLEILKDYFLFRAGRTYLDDSNQAYFRKGFDFNAKYLGGSVVRPDRQERCTKSTMYTFTQELDQQLIKLIFPKFPVAKFKAVASKIRGSIITGMKNNTWLGPETKAKAILKMEKAKLYLVKPETEKEWDFLPIRKYSAVDRFENGRIYQNSVREKQLKTFTEGTNLESWGMGPLTVNAYYEPSANKFVMPMGILQYPFFNPEGDIIENLGAVGAVIGHELGHGVDDQGSKYDETGKLKQWMTMKDLKGFSDRGHKMIEQFNKAGHNGMLTLGENIGDLVGLTFAYHAAFPDGKAKPEDERKLFIAYGRLWCGIARPKSEEASLKTDPHALGRARINEQVKHQKAFAKAFNCKPGDKMTLPESEMVQIW